MTKFFEIIQHFLLEEKKVGICPGLAECGMIFAAQYLKNKNIQGIWVMNEKRVGGKGSMNNRKGFTLVEAMIVICIMAVVAAIAIPQFQKMAINGNLKAAAKDVMSDFSSMRERAISENANFSIVFDQAHNNYTVPGLASPKTPAYFAKDIGINSTSFGTTITFQTRGTTSPPGDKTLTLINGRGSTATITTGTAGRIYVQYNLK